MMPYLSSYHEKEDDLEKTFDERRVSGMLKSAVEDIATLHKWERKVSERLGYIHSLSFTPVVKIWKTHNYNHRIEYDVSASRIADVPEGKVFPVYCESRRFIGYVKKHEAMEYAIALAEKYSVELTGDMAEETRRYQKKLRSTEVVRI